MTDTVRTAYEAYAATTGSLNFRGEPMPTWDTLPEPQRTAWTAAIAASTGNRWNSARPWLTADTVVLRGDTVLLIQRKDEPHQGCWALPGGYVDQGETSRAAAARELEEETGILADPAELTQIGAYDAVDRDSRDRVVTVAYLLEVVSGQQAVAGDDAAAAGWWSLDDLPELVADAIRMLTSTR